MGVRSVMHCPCTSEIFGKISDLTIHQNVFMDLDGYRAHPFTGTRITFRMYDASMVAVGARLVLDDVFGNIAIAGTVIVARVDISRVCSEVTLVAESDLTIREVDPVSEAIRRRVRAIRTAKDDYVLRC